MRKPRIDILTLFPDYFQGPFTVSMVKRALEKGAVDLKLHDLRQWATDKHHKADDVPFGGGAGMVMKPEPLFKALKALKGRRRGVKTVLLAPRKEVRPPESFGTFPRFFPDSRLRPLRGPG